MIKKFVSCFMFAALMSAGMISVVSCADYDSDIKALQQQIDSQATLQSALQTQVNNLEAQLKSLQETMNSFKSCSCGDVDAKIADAIAKALANANYATAESVQQAINNALAGLNTGLTQEEVEALIKAYHDAHPGLSESDVRTLIESYLKDNAGLTESDVTKLIETYMKDHPGSSLSEADVKSIIETYINNLQHFTQQEIADMINTAITQALANYQCNCNSITAEQVAAIVAGALEEYSKAHPYYNADAILAIAQSAIENSQVIVNIQNSITTLTQALDKVTTDLENLKKNVYTKEEVDMLLQQMLASAQGSLSDKQKDEVNALIEAYVAAHNDCICGFSTKDFNELRDQVSQLITDISNFDDKYVTIAVYTNAINEINEALILAQATADEALEIAKESKTIATSALDAANNAEEHAKSNEALITALSGTVSDMQGTILNIKTDLGKALSDAAAALAQAQTNANEIEALKQLLAEINSCDCTPYDDSALRNRIATLENEVEKLATKEELEQGLEDAMTLMDEALTLLADNLQIVIDDIYDQIGNLDARVGDLEEAYKNADKELQDQIDELNEALSNLTDRVKANEDAIKELQDKVGALEEKVAALAKQITSIVLEGTENPAFGYVSTPFGITSNVLLAYYGENEHKTNFPLIDGDGDLVNKDVIFTAEDASRIGLTQKNLFTQPGGTVSVDGEGNAGTLYLTVNPTNVDFTGVQFSLVNSQGKENAIKLSQLKYSEATLKYGYTRATNNEGFYEAAATVSAADVKNASISIESELKSAVKDIYNNKQNADFSSFAQAVYQQMNGIMEANAVKATWTDELGEHSVKSNHGIAAATAKPLSYNALADKSITLPGHSALQELADKNVDWHDYINLDDYNFSVSIDPVESPDFSDLEIYVQFAKLYVDSNGKLWVLIINEDGKTDAIEGTAVEASGVSYNDPTTWPAGWTLVTTEGIVKNEDGTYSHVVDPSGTGNMDYTLDKIVEQMMNAQSQNWSEQLQRQFKAQLTDKLADKFGKIVDDLNDSLLKVNERADFNKDIEDILDKMNDKFNSALNRAQEFIKKFDDFYTRVEDKLSNANHLLQTVMFYEGTDGNQHAISTDKDFPTVASGSGEAVSLYGTSYTGEVLAPAMKKFVAVTNVYKDGRDADSDNNCMKALKAANSGSANFGKVVAGDTNEFGFAPNKAYSGYTYEIIYSALDYHGKISQRKYYIRVK